MEISPETSQWLEEWQFYLYGSVAFVSLLAVLAVGGFFSWFARRIIRGEQLTIEERLKLVGNSDQTKVEGNEEDESEED